MIRVTQLHKRLEASRQELLAIVKRLDKTIADPRPERSVKKLRAAMNELQAAYTHTIIALAHLEQVDK